jgi:hypothetical protein
MYIMLFTWSLNDCWKQKIYRKIINKSIITPPPPWCFSIRGRIWASHWRLNKHTAATTRRKKQIFGNVNVFQKLIQSLYVKLSTSFRNDVSFKRRSFWRSNNEYVFLKSSSWASAVVWDCSKALQIRKYRLLSTHSYTQSHTQKNTN